MKITLTVLLGLLAFSALSKTIRADEVIPAPPASSHDESKKQTVEFMRKERNKRWDFEEKMLQINRQFEDEVRKTRHDADLDDENVMSSAADEKTGHQLLSEKRKTREKLWQEKRDAHRKEVDELRKKFREQTEADHKAFREAHSKGQ